MNNSIMGWIATFPEPYKKQAKANALKDSDYNYHDYNKIQYTNPISALTAAFEFEACEGFDYWNNFIETNLKYKAKHQ